MSLARCWPSTIFSGLPIPSLSRQGPQFLRRVCEGGFEVGFQMSIEFQRLVQVRKEENTRESQQSIGVRTEPGVRFGPSKAALAQRTAQRAFYISSSVHAGHIHSLPLPHPADHLDMSLCPPFITFCHAFLHTSIASTGGIYRCRDAPHDTAHHTTTTSPSPSQDRM